MSKHPLAPYLLRSQQQLRGALETLRDLKPQAHKPLAQGTCVLTLDKLRLLYFEHQTDQPKAPLLICYALVNRPDILDLTPNNSLIGALTEKGHPIYLIDWGYPDICDQHLGLDDYVGDYLATAIETVCELTNCEKVNLLGICQGGVFSLMYACLHPEKINRLITLVTPIDTAVKQFTLSEMIQRTQVASLIKAYGNLPGSFLNQIYASLKPQQLGVLKQLNISRGLVNTEQAERFLAMEAWINDNPDIAGKLALEFAEQFFQRNGLISGTLNIHEKNLSLSAITAPVLNIYGLKDHLVPPESSAALERALNKKTRYQDLVLDAGHIGVFMGQATQNKVTEAIINHLP